MYKAVFKRILDIVVALLWFAVSLPFFLVITLVLFFANNGKPFFIQRRIGKYEKIIKIIKFRTMNDNRDNEGQLLPSRERITAIGAIIRKASLDELPQLLNIIKGDLSFVGPRPLLTDYLPLYNSEHRKRHSVYPGITGWAQLNSKKVTSWQQKLDFDIWYVNNISFLLDCRIFFLSLIRLLNREGMSDKETLHRFNGTN